LSIRGIIYHNTWACGYYQLGAIWTEAQVPDASKKYFYLNSWTNNNRQSNRENYIAKT